MLETDEDALICDLAETYHIYDYRSLPMLTVATFAIGLGRNSRIKMKMRGEDFTVSEMLLAKMSDDIRWLCWSRTKDAKRGINRPDPVLKKMLSIKKEEEKPRTYMIFDTMEAFDEFIKKKRGG